MNKSTKIVWKKIEDLIPYEHNAKKHTETQIKNLATSLQKYGWQNVILIDEENVIVYGHGRILGAKEAGLTEAPCIVCTDLTYEERREYRHLDNLLSEGDYIQEEYDIDMPDLGDFDFSEISINIDLNPVEVDDNTEVIEDEPPEEVETRCQPGDIWQLGDHRLICGDSTDEETIARLMNGETADLVETDPPYNVSISNASGKTIQNDDMERGAFEDFLTRAFEQVSNHLKEGGVFYVWLATRSWVQFEQALTANGMIPHQGLVWNKHCAVLSRSDYNWKHEPCLYGWKDGAAHYYCEDFTQTTVIDEEAPDIEKMKKDELVAYTKNLIARINQNATVMDEKKPDKDIEHPTMKPVRLIAKQIANSSRIGETVLDTFGGSGTTLIACEQLKRRCYMCELDPHYCDVIIQRWENLTGERAERANG